MITVDNILVRKEILETKFSCDLKKCKGACCTLESQFGAPLKTKEIDIIEGLLPVVLPYLDSGGKEEIKERGFWEEKDGELMTRSIDDKQCVFVIFENNVAKCAIEKAYYDGKINFKKPLSCHLFPIRITNFGGETLRYEKFKECEPALENGRVENTTIAEFCKESLVRLYGLEWYTKLNEKTRNY